MGLSPSEFKNPLYLRLIYHPLKTEGIIAPMISARKIPDFELFRFYPNTNCLQRTWFSARRKTGGIPSVDPSEIYYREMDFPCVQVVYKREITSEVLIGEWVTIDVKIGSADTNQEKTLVALCLESHIMYGNLQKGQTGQNDKCSKSANKKTSLNIFLTTQPWWCPHWGMRTICAFQ